ncbi:cadmium resistance transporter [Pediococcus stilesii]|uniref:cadmium resistance transporter n=1 Tax=Pediococcus stilesii TaxID=331679 RepID=UPI00070F4F69|nr:cadmium resistance transporter [Pediococcus stilesii]
MLTDIVTGITAYISTSIDYLIVLMVIFATVSKNNRILVYLGDILGTIVLVAASLIVAFVLKAVPSGWMLGLLGLIPVGMGIKLLIAGQSDDGDVIERQITNKRGVILNVAFITIATCGADNIGIYVPLFTQMNVSSIITVLFTFAVMLTIFALIGYLLVKLPLVAKIFDRWGGLVTAIVYIGLGGYILLESGTIQHFIQI